MIPQRFVTEYPARCMEMFDLMEPIAREKGLVGSFSLVVATSVFVIPYERMKTRHPLNHGEPQEMYAAIRAVERGEFLAAPFWEKNEERHPWRFSRIMNAVNQTLDWRDAQGNHPMAQNADNTIQRRTVDAVFRVLRNALAHGNVVYLDENGFERKGAAVQHLAFLSRYEQTDEDRAAAETYRLVVTTEEGFLSFIKAWATWLAQLPPDDRISEVA